MSTMKDFYNLLFASENQDARMEVLAALTKLSLAELVAVTAELGWQIWNAPEKQPAS